MLHVSGLKNQHQALKYTTKNVSKHAYEML